MSTPGSDVVEVMELARKVLWETGQKGLRELAFMGPGDGTDVVADAWQVCNSGRAMLDVLEAIADLQRVNAVTYRSDTHARRAQVREALARGERTPEPVESAHHGSDDWRHGRDELPLALYVVNVPTGAITEWQGTDIELATEVRRLWPTVTWDDVRSEVAKRFTAGVPPPTRARFERSGKMLAP